MKYINNYKQHNTQQYINENVSDDKHTNIVKNIKNDLGLNLYFISTFGTSIPALYPLIEKLIKNTDITVSTEQIILLTICAISMFIKESKDDSKKLIKRVKEEGLLNTLNTITTGLESIFKIFKNIAKYFGKTINGLTDMLAYVSLLVPFSIVLIEVINNFDMSIIQIIQLIDDPKGLLIATGVGMATITLKQLITYIIKKLVKKKY